MGGREVMAGEFDGKQIANLLGGYAAGTLTAAERKALFEAALEDQALFEMLAEEEPLRELLADPVAKAELRAVLEPAPSRPGGFWAWMRRPAFGGLAIAGAVAALMLVVVRPWQSGRQKEQPLEMARNREPAPELLRRQAPVVADRKDTPARRVPAKPMAAPKVIVAEEREAKKENVLVAASPPPPAAASPVTSFRETASADQAAAGGTLARAKSRQAAPRQLGAAALGISPEISVVVQRNGAPVDAEGDEFSNQDGVRLAIAVPGAGHLYVLERRGAGGWRFVFPADPASEAASRVEPRAVYLAPAGTPIQANEAGEITMLVLFSAAALDLSAGADSVAKSAVLNLGLKSREVHLNFR